MNNVYILSVVAPCSVPFLALPFINTPATLIVNHTC